MKVAVAYQCPRCGFHNYCPNLSVGPPNCGHDDCHAPHGFDDLLVAIHCGACGYILDSDDDMQAQYGLPTCAN